MKYSGVKTRPKFKFTTFTYIHTFRNISTYTLIHKHVLSNFPASKVVDFKASKYANH